MCVCPVEFTKAKKRRRPKAKVKTMMMTMQMIVMAVIYLNMTYGDRMMTNQKLMIRKK